MPPNPAPHDPRTTNTPPQPAAPPNPAPEFKSGAGHVDFDKLVLPKKNQPSVDSAQRVNAGVLFDQEQRAAAGPVEKSPGGGVPDSQSESGVKDFSSADPAEGKKEQALVRPLQTYQGDIESLVGERQVSVVSIAAAEANKRAAQPLSPEQAALVESSRTPLVRKLLVIGGGVVLLIAATGIGFYIYLQMQPVSVAEQFPAPFILVDDTRTVQINTSDTRNTVMQALMAAHQETMLSLGLVARIQVVKPTALGQPQEVGAPELLQILGPQVPPELVRTLLPQMLLGVHSYGENEAFMILKADSYETAYSGALAWESTMRADLLPLFARTPAVRPRAEPLPVATTTASTTSAASSTPPVQFFGGNFIDQVVANRDARVVLNQEGDILLLWTMLDRSTIVITTNDASLREVISRLSQASILSLPASQ